MIKVDSLSQIGRVTKTHGYKGEVLINLEYPKDIFTNGHFPTMFIKIDGIIVPFFVESIRGNSQEKAYFKFENLDSEDEASIICGEEIFVEKKWLAEVLEVEVDELEGDEDISGYIVIDSSTGEKIGKVEDVLEGIEYDYLQVKDDYNNEILIPLVDDYIDNIEEKEKSESESPGMIYMSLPDGFLSIRH